MGSINSPSAPCSTADPAANDRPRPTRPTGSTHPLPEATSCRVHPGRSSPAPPESRRACWPDSWPPSPRPAGRPRPARRTIGSIPTPTSASSRSRSRTMARRRAASVRGPGRSRGPRRHLRRRARLPVSRTHGREPRRPSRPCPRPIDHVPAAAGDASGSPSPGGVGAASCRQTSRRVDRKPKAPRAFADPSPSSPGRPRRDTAIRQDPARSAGLIAAAASDACRGGPATACQTPSRDRRDGSAAPPS